MPSTSQLGDFNLKSACGFASQRSCSDKFVTIHIKQAPSEERLSRLHPQGQGGQALEQPGLWKLWQE